MSRTLDLALVIDRTALIENMLNQVIEGFCAPQKRAFPFFWNVVLDSSIMPLGSKVKVAMAIAQELRVKLDQNALHSVISLRNAFAHHGIGSHPVCSVGMTPEEDRVHYELQVVANSGKVSRMRREAALASFNSSYQDARESLASLLKAIKGRNAPDAA
jgi:hypothetical protein